MVVRGDGGSAGAPLRPSDPTRLGRYGVLRRLGEGGMGTVYLGRSETGRPVAIKVIRADSARQDEFRARFRREATNARRVARFCTAEVLDADPDAELPYLVTEYVEGSTLASVVAAEGPLSSANLERLAVGVAAALTAIHGAGVVHRDLKPSNVLLSPFGPRVIDFGIARAVDATIGMSQDLWRMGTPAFMSPEQVRGEPVGAAADVFAWGGVVAFAGTGRYPFGEGPLPVLLYRITSEEPWLSGLDNSLRPIVARALGKDPAHRPTATELLMSLLGGSASATDPRPAVHQALRGWEQPRVEAPTRVVPAGPFGAPPGPPPPPFGGPAGAPYGPPQPPPRGPERPPRRRGMVALAVGGVVAVAAGAVAAPVVLTGGSPRPAPVPGPSASTSSAVPTQTAPGPTATGASPPATPGEPAYFSLRDNGNGGCHRISSQDQAWSRPAVDDQKCSYTAESIDAWYYRWGRKADLDSSWRYWTDNGAKRTGAWSSNAYRGQYVCISVTGDQSGLYWKDDANSYTGVLVDTSTASASPAAAASPSGATCTRLLRWWEARG